MTYCSGSSKAVVTYTLAGQPKRVEVVANLPITVSGKQGAGGSSANNSFSCGLQPPSCGIQEGFYLGVTVAKEGVTDGELVRTSGWFLFVFGNATDVITTQYTNDGTYVGYKFFKNGVEVWHARTRLANPTICGAWYYCPGSSCRIVIKDSTGTIVHQESGSCPMDFTVACGDGCPPGHIRCECDTYPGYCCISCEELSSQVRAITEEVKNV